MGTENKELNPNLKEFRYTAIPTSTEIFPEITVVIEFTIGLKEPRSFTGDTHMIKENDAKKMEVESFFEAAEEAWNKHYKMSSNPETIEFVKTKLLNKWTELKGKALTKKILKLD